jgi:uncharacterized repeat protein (TIGR04138 family)
MHEITFEEAVELVRAKDPRYTADAYQFVKEALEHTQKSIGKDKRGRIRHVTGQELLEGIRLYALERYGPMALMLLQEWGVQGCGDFGELVFNLIDIGLLAKTPADSKADFQVGYDFAEAFRKPYLPSAKQAEPEAKTAPSVDS